MKRYLAPLALLLLPGIASAQTMTAVVGVFNIFVGLMLAAAFLLYFGGLVVWFIRLGTWPTYRDEAIEYMQWAVAVLFVLVVLLALVQFVQNHTATAMLVLGFIIVGLVAWAVFTVASAPDASEEEH
ncbi:MAG: hypothetical protein JWM46_406 [Candidatus Kaiserbacteria bacterium]|nr:hypothetical protein [Candidatus Kaiserbacteria bacterium]